MTNQTLSPADRTCSAPGIQHDAPVWTADRLWAQIETGAKVRLARE
ncbi:MAG: hypothetical protein NZ553_08720 [Caldilinea sp.]|nr:hypothetical protein [Caldilinea sp.]MDW8440540.1 hypothetical protein [Caldilineaceae bacterium]